MRTLVYQSLLARADLAELIGDRIYVMGSTGIGDIPARPEKPFIIITFADAWPYHEVSETSDVERKSVQIYAYQHRGDYTLIDRMLAIVRQTLVGLTGETSPSGARCTGVSYRGTSADLWDEPYDASMRFATFYFTAGSSS